MDVNGILKKDYIKKIINTTNTLFGLISAILAIFVIGFKPIPLAISFIVFDFISLILNFFLIHFIVFLFKTKDDLSSLYSYINNIYCSDNEDYFYEYFLKHIRNKIDYLKAVEKKNKEIAKAKEQKQDNSISLNKTLNTQKDIFKNGVKSLRSFDYENTNITYKKYVIILKNLDKLEDALNKNEQGYIFVDTTFTLFSTEVLKLLKSFSVLGNNIGQENKEKMNTLLDAFNDYLKRTIDKIISQNQTIIDASYDVVLKNINKTN